MKKLMLSVLTLLALNSPIAGTASAENFNTNNGVVVQEAYWSQGYNGKWYYRDSRGRVY